MKLSSVDERKSSLVGKVVVQELQAEEAGEKITRTSLLQPVEHPTIVFTY
jgi:hypothetical protein